MNKPVSHIHIARVRHYRLVFRESSRQDLFRVHGTSMVESLARVSIILLVAALKMVAVGLRFIPWLVSQVFTFVYLVEAVTFKGWRRGDVVVTEDGTGSS